MSYLLVEKSPPLSGRVRVDACKNSVLPLMAAALLTQEPVVLVGAPPLSDVHKMAELLASLGAQVTQEEDHSLRIVADKLHTREAPADLVHSFRASFLIAGPLLARFGRSRVPLPGGCQIGTRPVDLHLKGLEALGARVNLTRGYIGMTSQGLVGNSIYLDYPSVGGTENILMAACLAEGRTVLLNAAREPEIEDLATMLRHMGARIEGAGTDTIVVEGVPQLSGVRYVPMGDRIEAGTFLFAAAITRGDVQVEGVRPDHMKPVTAKLQEAGVMVEELPRGRGLHVASQGRPQAVDIKTLPWPGFPTDLQAPAMVLAALAKGASVITETVFENRFMHVAELERMGAHIRITDRVALIDGVARLSGAMVSATDLRAGAALVLAALAADGKTMVRDDGHIARGYVDFPGKLQALGAPVSLIEEQA